jgi:type I restriction enzyme M protein
LSAKEKIMPPEVSIPAERIEKVEDDDEPFKDKMARLTATLAEQLKEATTLEKAIRQNLAELGFDL